MGLFLAVVMPSTAAADTKMAGWESQRHVRDAQYLKKVASTDSNYIVTTFEVFGVSYVYFRDVNVDTGGGQPNEQYTKMLIRYGRNVQIQSGGRGISDADIHLLSAQYFYSNAEAAQQACQYEQQGYQVWSHDACAPKPGPVLQLSGRLSWEPSDARVMDTVTFHAEVTDPGNSYPRLQYQWYVDGSRVTDQYGNVYDAATMSYAFNIAGPHNVSVQVLNPDSNASTTLQGEPYINASATSSSTTTPSTTTSNQPTSQDFNFDGKDMEWLQVLFAVIALLASLLFLKPLLKLLWWLIKLPFRMLSWLFSIGSAGDIQPPAARPSPVEPPPEKKEEQPPEEETPPDPKKTPLEKLKPEMLDEQIDPVRDLAEKTWNKKKKYPADIAPYVQAFQKAAKATKLTPEVIAAFVLSEWRDMEEHEEWTDWAKATISDNASVGIGQVRIATAKKHDLLGVKTKNLSSGEIYKLLTTPETGIQAVAEYIRWLADRGARFPASPKYKSDMDFNYWRNTHYPGLDLLDLKKPAAEWSPGHIVLLGSEYTTYPFDDVEPLKWDFGWGLNVLMAFQDILRSGIFKVSEK